LTGGYYLASNADELAFYCDRLGNRLQQVGKTRAALMKTLRRMRAAERANAKAARE
jgi:hypothetical protein